MTCLPLWDRACSLDRVRKGRESESKLLALPPGLTRLALRLVRELTGRDGPALDQGKARLGLSELRVVSF